MPATTIFLLIGAFLLSLALAWFQYFFRAKGKRSRNAIFGTLRFLVVFALLVLLINPKINRTEYYNEKPVLVLAVDNSSSIKEFGAGEEVPSLMNRLSTDPDLQENFEIETFSFGRELKPVESLGFNESQTNLSTVFKDLSILYEGQIAPVVLITDGNQTIGEEFTFAAQSFGQPVLPVVVGDTAHYQDLSISRINVNKYAFLNNRFPVEIMVNYSGDTSAETQLDILRGNAVVHSQQLSFTPDDNSEVVQVQLLANSVGIQNYKVQLSPLEAEKNVLNNSREIAVEVVDERTKVLVAYSFLHPDLGALKKAIESNQQREVDLKPISEIQDINDYQLVMLYQPDARFGNLMEQLHSQNRNYFLITGPKTNWNFLNRAQEFFQQEITNQSEEYFPVWNENFNAFQTDDINYSDFPPLVGNFGNLDAPNALDVLLYREMQGVETTMPLLGVTAAGDSKIGFLFGAGIWRWRGVVFRETGSFQNFDDLIGKLVHFLAAGSRQDRLVINYDPLYNASEEVVIRADFFDQSYEFDPRAALVLQLKNEKTGEELQIPFVVNERSFEVDLSSLPGGQYDFTVKVEGGSLSRSGSFRILDFDVEKQFARANLEGLQQIATQKEQNVYFLDEFERLKSQLLSADSYATIQKSRKKDVSLIDWKYLLGIMVLALSAEWFLRKYFGFI